MTTDEFKALGADLFGNSWQTRMARAMGVDPSSVRRWISGALPIPAPVAAYLEALAGRQRARGALVFERQRLGAPVATAPSEPTTLGHMRLKPTFPGVDSPKPMPAIAARRLADGTAAISMDDGPADSIADDAPALAATRHPDGSHLEGYMAAAARAGHRAVVATHRFHHHTLIAHDGAVRLTRQIATHSGATRTLTVARGGDGTTTAEASFDETGGSG